MGFMDKLTAGAERAAKEAEKAFDKGKAKVGELQLEMQMDGLAKKLGFLVFDFYRGREVDQAQRQKYLDELSRLEDQLLQARAEAAAKKAAAQSATAGAAQGGPWPPAGQEGWAPPAGAAPAPETAPETAAAAEAWSEAGQGPAQAASEPDSDQPPEDC